MLRARLETNLARITQEETMTIPFDTVAYICIYCADLDTSMRFYRDVLALPPVRRDPDICKFALQGTSLGLERGG